MYKQKIENCIQELMQGAVHAAKPSTHRATRTMLQHCVHDRSAVPSSQAHYPTAFLATCILMPRVLLVLFAGAGAAQHEAWK